MRDQPHHREVIQEHDIAHILDRFEDEFVRSKLPNKLVIDTTDDTVEESLAELITGLGPFFTQEDKRRLDSHKQT